MSIYDDLADSAYLDRDEFRKHLQINSQGCNDNQLDGSRLIGEYNTSDSAKVNQDDNFSQFGLVEQYHYPKGDNFTRSEMIIERQGEQRNNLQMSSGIQPSIDSKFLLMQSQIPNDQKLAKEDLISKRHVICEDFDEEPFERDYKFDVAYTNMQNNNQTGKFGGQLREHNFRLPPTMHGINPTDDRDPFNIERYRQNNDQIQQILQQIGGHSKQQYRPSNPKMEANFEIQSEANMILGKSAISNENNRGHHHQHILSGLPLSQGSGPNYNKLNKDNSILEIAKMQNSNASNSETLQNQSIVDREYLNEGSRDVSPATHIAYPISAAQLDILSQPIAGSTFIDSAYQYFQMPPSVTGQSMLQGHDNQQFPQQQQQQKQVLHHNRNLHSRQVSESDKENLNSNNLYIQIPAPIHLIHAKTSHEPELMQMQNIRRESEIQKIANAPMSKTNFYKDHQLMEKEMKKREIMDNFDDIPIKEFNKVEAQQQQINEDAAGNDDNIDNDSLTLIQRIEHPKWKVRMRAYKDISDLFYIEYSKDQGKPKFNPMTTEQEEQVNISPFEQYLPILQKVITDSNLVAQYEGLNCLYAYIRFAPDIKQAIFMVHGILLEKIQHNKPNMREITLKILQTMIMRDKSQSLNIELMRRFRNKNVKIACFSMEVAINALRSSLLIEESTLKSIFRAFQENVSHTNKDIRDIAIELLIEIFKNSNDDVNSFLRNLKSLRPIQVKEIKDILQETEKQSISKLIHLFDNSQPSQKEEGSTPKKQKTKLDSDRLQKKQEVIATADNDQEQEVDLISLIPENFYEIPYLSQISTKKKGMEAFNAQLEALINKSNFVHIVNKDYISIFNVVTHMLEDSNALVFMEAIKTVEYLAILMGKSIKQQKFKQFIGILADKYKETKTAPISAVNKALSTIIKKQCLPVVQIVEFLICTQAYQNKNPRVKQMILEKVDSILVEEAQRIIIDDLMNMFKTIKDKVIGFIQKDTNAGVRDAAVLLLINFKAQLFDQQIVDEAISTLPKYRVLEIIKEASLKQKQFHDAAIPSSQQKQRSSSKEQRPSSAKEDLLTNMLSTLKNDLIGQLRKLSSASEHQLQSLNVECLAQIWDESIDKVGEPGVQAQKPLIIATVHQLLLQIKIPIQSNVALLESMLVLLKKIFCIDRTVTKDPATGNIPELDQTIEIALYGCTILENKKQTEALLNVVLSAADSPKDFIVSLKNIMCSFVYFDNYIEKLDFLFKWLAVKSDYFFKRGISFAEFEELRCTGLQLINDKTESNEKSKIISILVEFKNAVETKLQTANVGNIHVASTPVNADQIKQEPQYTLGEIIVKSLESDFEKGLLMIKNIPQNPSGFDQASKEVVFSKLLSIVCVLCQNQQQQYQQAYALKALLWMREEIFGLEDTFKFTTKVLAAYAHSEVNSVVLGKDSSVELYLLNYWVRELSLRDLIDRVSNASLTDEKYFLVLLKWLMQNKLEGNSEEKWVIEDFRKLAIYFAKNLNNEQVIEFFNQAVEKFGKIKVRDFMEIQLMHFQSEYNQFIVWFNLKYKFEMPQPEPKSNSKEHNLKPKSIKEETKVPPFKPQAYEDAELHDALSSPNIQLPDIAQYSSRPQQQQQQDHQSLYKQLRQQRKFTNQKKNKDEDYSSENKYDQIINRLEAQLQNNHVPMLSDDRMQTPQQEVGLRVRTSDLQTKIRSTSRGDTNKRYQHVNMEEQETADNNVDQFQETQNQLLESSRKESQFKDELQKFEMEKLRIEREREQLLKEKDQQTKEWQQKYEHMTNEHEEVIQNLKEANKCYLQQVGQNEQLRQQLLAMQEQNNRLLEKFTEYEQKLNDIKIENDKQSIVKRSDIQVVSEERFLAIKESFNIEGERGVETQKIQELLLNFTQNGKKMNEKEIGEPLQMYYQQAKSQDQKLLIVKALHNALNKSEDVLFALPLPTFKAVLDFTLKAFGQEKALLEEKYIRGSAASGRQPNDQNEITVQVQKIVSKLLNSKEFTTSLVCLFEILRESMPENLNTNLTNQQKHHLKVLLRCIQRINKALPSEHPDLVRAFDVLLEMQKLFQKNPPESLREDLPCLEDFDQVYRGLKDVADRMMELQPDKTRIFLEFVGSATERHKNENAFIKYMRQVMGMRETSVQQDDNDISNSYLTEEY